MCKTHRKVYIAPCFAYLHRVGHKRFWILSGLKAGGGWGEGAKTRVPGTFALCWSQKNESGQDQSASKKQRTG